MVHEALLVFDFRRVDFQCPAPAIPVIHSIERPRTYETQSGLLSFKEIPVQI